MKPDQATCSLEAQSAWPRAQKDEILHYVKKTSVADISSKFDVTETTIYEWQRADKRRNINANGNEPSIKEKDPAVIRDRKILATWREHPGYGPSQTRVSHGRSRFCISFVEGLDQVRSSPCKQECNRLAADII